MKTVAAIRSKVEKIRWGNKKRPFEGDLQDLKSLYWHIVAHEILGDDNLKSNNPEYHKSYLVKIVNTYAGIFFWYFEVKFALKKRFDGLHFRSIKDEKKLWDSWREEIIEERNKIYSEILTSIINSQENRLFMIENRNILGRPFKVYDYIHHNSNKTLSIADFLAMHRTYDKFVINIPKVPEIYFRYVLKDKLIERLHRLGEKLIVKTLTDNVLTEYNVRFQELYQTEYFLDEDKEKIERLPKTVSVYKKLPIKEALDDILSNYSWSKLLTPQQLKYHVMIGYRDQEDNEFKNDSVYHAIRRGGYGANVE